MHARGVSREPNEAEAASTGDSDQQAEQAAAATGSTGASNDADTAAAASAEAAAAPFRPRSVGSVVMGLVGRAPPRSGPGEDDDGADGEEGNEEASDVVDGGDAEAGDNIADSESSGPKNSPTFNLPAHSASRTRCPLCENLFDLSTHLPILLHAGHTFCNFCMSSSNALAPVGSSVTCPVCKLTVEVPLDTGAKEAFKSELKARAKLQQSQGDNGSDANTSTASTTNEANVPLSPFPVNFLIRDSLELTKIIDDIRSNNIVCDKCDDKAIGKCLICDMTLCEFHVQDHKKSKETRNHPLQDFAEFLSALPSPGGAADANTSVASASPLAASFLSSNQKSIMRQKQYCQHHPEMELDLFCLECNIPICQKCSIPSGGTIHSGNSSGSILPHPTEHLKSASLRSFNELQHLNEQTKMKYTNIIKGMVEIQKVAQKIQAREQKVASQIVGYFDALHQILEARKLKLLTRLSELVSSKNYTLNLQNQILYIVARALEDASMEVDSMLDAVVSGASSDFDTILRKEIDPRTNANGPDSTIIAPQPFHSLMASSPNSSGVNVSLASVKSTNTTLDTSISNYPTAVTPTSLSSKLLHVQGHLSANLEALLKFQPVALHPEDSDQFSFVVTNPPASANGKVQSSPTSAGASSVTNTPRTSPILQKSYSEDTTSFLDERVLQSISKTGIVGDSMAIASLCTASGEGLTSCFVRSESRFLIQARDRFNQPKTRGGDPFVVEFIGPKGSASGRVMDHQNGTYTVRYMVLQPGSYSVIVSIHGRHIAGSPFRVTVQGAKDGLLSIGREWLTSVGSRGTSPSQFMNPMGIAISTDAHVFVADYGNNRLSVYKAMSGGLNFPFLRSIGKSGSENAALKNPWSLAFDPVTNNLYVSDTGNHRIQVFTSATGEWVRSWGAVGSGAGKFRTPAGIAIYTPLVGNVNFSDDASFSSPAATGSAANASGDKNASSSSAGNDATSSEVAGSPVAASSLSTSIAASLTPYQLSVQREQLVFVSDREKNRVQVFDMSGRFIRLFGSSGSGPSQFLHPSGLALDPRRQILYVADFSNHRIQAFNLKGEFLRMWGVRGNLPGQFLDPVGVSVDRTGLVYVSEQSNQRVQVFAPDGTFLRMLGTSGSGAGSNSKGSFQKPTAIAIASFKADGNVLQLHEDAGDEAVAGQEDAAASGSVEVVHKGVVTHTLVFVSDAANHKLHVFQ